MARGLRRDEVNVPYGQRSRTASIARTRRLGLKKSFETGMYKTIMHTFLRMFVSIYQLLFY